MGSRTSAWLILTFSVTASRAFSHATSPMCQQFLQNRSKLKNEPRRSVQFIRAFVRGPEARNTTLLIQIFIDGNGCSVRSFAAAEFFRHDLRARTLPPISITIGC